MDYSTLLLSAAFAVSQAAAPRPQSVNLRVSAQGTGHVAVSEHSWRVNASGFRRSDGGFHLSGTAGNASVSISANAMGNGSSRSFSLFGSGVNANLSRSGSSWNLWGSVDGEHLNMHINPFGSGYNLWGLAGASLNAHKWANEVTVSGSVDSTRTSAKTLALLGAALAAVSAEPSVNR